MHAVKQIMLNLKNNLMRILLKNQKLKKQTTENHKKKNISKLVKPLIDIMADDQVRMRYSQYCPYKYKHELVKWADSRYPTKQHKYWSKKRLYALYYNTK